MGMLQFKINIDGHRRGTIGDVADDARRDWYVAEGYAVPVDGAVVDEVTGEVVIEDTIPGDDDEVGDLGE